MKRTTSLAALGLVLVLLAGCAGARAPFLGAKSCADRPTELDAYLECDLPDGLEIASVERRACDEEIPGHERIQAEEVVDAYTLAVRSGKAAPPFARIRIEESAAARYSSHKWAYMENFHVMAEGTVPGAEVHGYKTFWIDEKPSAPGDPETLRVLFADEDRAIVSISFLHAEGKERSREAQDAFVAAYAQCLKEAE